MLALLAAIAALLGAASANAGTVDVCTYEADGGCGSFPADEGEVVGSGYAVYSCRGSSGSIGEGWAHCDSNGGDARYRFAWNLLPGDSVLAPDGGGVFVAVEGFAFYGASAPEDPEDPTDDGFQISDIDPLVASGLFAFGFVLIGTCKIIGIGARTALGVLKR